MEGGWQRCSQLVSLAIHHGLVVRWLHGACGSAHGRLPRMGVATRVLPQPPMRVEARRAGTRVRLAATIEWAVAKRSEASSPASSRCVLRTLISPLLYRSRPHSPISPLLYRSRPHKRMKRIHLSALFERALEQRGEPAGARMALVDDDEWQHGGTAR